MTGLVGWWPLHRETGDAVDLSGEGNDGTVNGATRGVAGRGGLQAYSFDGSDDNIDTGLGTVGSSSGEYTIAFWLRFNGSTSNVERFTGNYNNTSDDIWIGNDSSNDIRYRDDVAGDLSVNGILPTDEWIHVAMVSNGSNIEGYKNATSQGTDGSGRSGSSSTGQNLLIGEEANGNVTQSVIMDYRLYDRALSSNEIQRLYEWGNGDYAQPPSDVDDTDAVSYWTWDSDASDSWGSNGGTLNGNASANTTPDIRGGALDLDGSGDYVQVSDSSSLDVTNFTLSSWVRVDSIDGSNPEEIIDKNSAYGLRNNGSGVWETSVTVSGTQYTATTSNTTVAGDWLHLTGTFDGSKLILYVNGVQEGKNSNPSSAADTNSNNLGIGGDVGGADYFAGGLDDTRIYSRALSPAEIHRVYRYGTFGKDLREETVKA